ncbi:MAG TPA: oxygenase MpaB family protein [Polyangiaceae bacterium]|nr:oxygenase MpaB family protein [Polyangiaceae bacterium]
MTHLVTDQELDVFRSQGDPLLDGLVASLSPGAVGEMLGALFRSDHIPTDDPRFRALLDALSPIPLVNSQLVEAGQRLFELYGPEVLLILGCYGLPAAYAAANGVQVIHRARRLEDDAKRRLCETAQMVINVMRPGGLTPDGIGYRSAIKVRIMHALIRHHVRTASASDSRSAPWSSTYGEPINQEDLAGTLLTFSLLVLDGLRKIGVNFSDEEEIGYLEAWHHVGLIVGVDPRLAPRTLDEAKSLATLIGRRQFRPSPEGQRLTRELVRVTETLFPVPGYGTSLMHFFLDESVFGVNLAETLDLPPANWTRILVRARAAQKQVVLRWLNRVPGARGRRRAFASHFTQMMILWERPDKTSPFEIPADLAQRWRLTRPKA